MPVLGQISLPLQFGTIQLVDFLVTNSVNEVILGMPFLYQTSACFDFGQIKLTIDGEHISMHDQMAKPILSMVYLSQTLTLAQKQEYLTSGLIRTHGKPCL